MSYRNSKLYAKSVFLLNYKSTFAHGDFRSSTNDFKLSAGSTE